MIRHALAGLALAASFAAGAQPRANAVFLLGADEPGRDPFFAPALAWHREHARAGDLVVASARSLEEVREWLARSPLRGGQPWGEVTIVAHGSPWLGLAVPLFRRGEAATASQLASAIADGSFPPLAERIVDGESILRLDSCGVGRRDDLMAAYAALIRGRDGAVPRVEASREWIEYGSATSDGRIATTWRRERPFVAELVARRTLSAGAESKLRERLAARLPRGDAPPRWTLAPVRLEAAMPDAAWCARAKATRLARQPDVQRVLADHGLAAHELAWRHERHDGRCVLVGDAILATLGVGELPQSALPAPRALAAP